MPATNSGVRSAFQRLKDWAVGGGPTRPSLFHYIQDEPETNVLPDLWNLLRHPIRAIKEERSAPSTRASLFHYLAQPGDGGGPIDWKDLLRDLFTGYRFAIFIPSLWSDQKELNEERAALRTRRMEAGVASMMIHMMLVGSAIYMVYRQSLEPPAQKDPVIFVQSPMNLPFEGDGREGGGGGGGGKREKELPSGGRMPDLARVQFMPPDPGQPKPLVPVETPLDMKASVQMPIDFPVNAALPIGDITAPPSDRLSSGPGSGGGIGAGTGTGAGPGSGPGVGPGSDGGIGGGRGGGIGPGVGPYVSGNGVTEPVAIEQPKPPYTEDARKNRTEGVVLLQVIIRSNGRVDGIKVIKGLGNGLDESAINTIATKWRFRPALFRGSAVDFQAQIEVTFRLF